MKDRLFVVIAALILLLGVARAEGGITSKEQLNEPGRTIGISQGSAAEDAVMAEFPEAEIAYFTDNLLGYTAVAQGKIDAYVYDRVQMQLTIDNGLTGVHLLPEDMGETVKIAVGYSGVSRIPGLQDSLNRFIAEVKADGTLDDMYRRWVLEGNTALPEIPPAQSPKLRLTVGTTGNVPPYSYYGAEGLTGFDIELAHRFAAWLGAELSFEIYDFDGIVPAANSGKIDVIMSNLQYLPERSGGLPFSDILYEEKMGVMVRDSGGEAAQGTAFAALDDLNGRRIGILTGSSFDLDVRNRLPDAQPYYFNSQTDLLAALSAGKIDAFPSDEPVIRYVMGQHTGITYIPEYIDTFEFAYCFPMTEAGEALRDQFSEFITGMWEDGRLDALSEEWFGSDEGSKTLPDLDALPATNGTLVMATDGDYVPFEYVRDGVVVGYDVDLAAQFCEAYGYGLRVEMMSMDAVLQSVQGGKCNFGGSAITITPERAESVLFSEPYYVGGTVMVVVNRAGAAAEARPEFADFSDLSGRTVSMLTGAPFEELVRSKAPDVGEFTFFNGTPDMIQALKAHKTDAFLMNNAVGQLVLNRNPDLALFPQSLQDGAFGIAFAKGDARRDQWQAAYDAIPRSEIQGAWEKWTGADDSIKVLPEQDWPGANGTVRVAACDTLEPMSYVGGNGELKGFDLEVILMIARELDVKVEFTGMEFSAILAAVQSGKADLGAGSIIITEERAEEVDFLEYQPAAFVLIVRTASASLAAQEDSPWSGFLSSFEKTFLRENRWQLFAQGILTTLLITVLTILFGTLLGFGVFMLCRNGNPFANGVTRFCLWLVQGMPMVVLLMILYYVIFGSLAISGVVVAVIGFTLTFGSAVFGLLKMGVGAVDAGQYEAAYALGYSNARTFFRIILPQALPHVLPAYRGEIVGLIKATAIVGYIAVQDLTKMGDIVRSRTYEAFFPLIAITIIYFALEGLIGFVVSRVSLNVNPKRRKPEDILKGVKTGD